MSIREQGGKLVLDIDPSKVKTYLKLLTESCINLDKSGEGVTRKLIWDYLHKKYRDSIDYRDFLLAIRRFIIDGKITNKEGYYQMHPEVVEEVKKRTPTPAFQSRSSKENIFLNQQKSKKLSKQGGSKESTKSQDANIKNKVVQSDEQDNQNDNIDESRSRSSKRNTSSKLSNSGKKQKVKPHKESTKQSKIEKYYMKKQIQSMKDLEEFEQTKLQNKKLGFATPAPDYEENKYQDYNEDEQIVMLREESDDEDSGLHLSQPKLGFNTQPVQQKRGRKAKVQQEQIVQEPLSQRIPIKTKAISKVQQKKESKAKTQVLSQKQQKPKKARRPSNLSQSLIDLSQDNLSISEMERTHRHPIQFLTQPIETKVTEKTIAKPKGRKTKIQLEIKQSQKTQLSKNIVKALKEAEQNKFIRLRKDHNLRKPAPSKPILKKTKAIKKAKKLVQAPEKMKLRGKTLDLTKLGLIKKAKVKVQVESPKPLKTKPKTASRGVTPKKEKKNLVDSDYEDQQILSQRSDKKSKEIAHSQEKQIQKSAQKKAKSRQPSSSRQKPVKHTQSTLLSKVELSNIVYSDRKAKLDAAKNLKQLYSMHTHREGFFIDEKFIYL